MEELPVSVVIPAYNRARLVGRAVDSVLRQRRYRAAEIIVVDDGSSDDTIAVAERHGARVVAHGRNRGLPAGRNSGLKAATHPWVAYLDSDDEWLPNLLETLWPLRAGHVVVGGTGLARAASREGDHWAGTHARRPFVVRSPAQLVSRGTFIGPSGVLIDRAAALRAGGSDESLPRVGGAEDLDLWIRVLEQGTGYITPEPVALYHLAGEGAAEVQGDQLGQLAAFENIVSRYVDRPWVSDAVLQRSRGLAAWIRLRAAMRAGEAEEVRRQARELLGHPYRTAGAVDLVLRRRLLARRRCALSHEGLPTAAVLPGVAEAARQRADGHPEQLTDLRDRSLAAALREVAARPPARTYVGSRSQALAVRLAGSEPVYVDPSSA